MRHLLKRGGLLAFLVMLIPSLFTMSICYKWNVLFVVLFALMEVGVVLLLRAMFDFLLEAGETE